MENYNNSIFIGENCSTYIDSVVLKYNKLLLKLRKYRELDIARTKKLECIIHSTLSEGIAGGCGEVQNILDNIQYLAVDTVQRTVDEEETFCRLIFQKQLQIHNFQSNSELLFGDGKSGIVSNTSGVNYTDPFSMNEELSEYNNIFRVLDSRVGALLHSIKSTRMVETTSLIDEINNTLVMSGLSESILRKLLIEENSAERGNLSPLSIIKIPDHDESAMVFRLTQSLYHGEFLGCPIEREGDFVTQMLQSLRRKHRAVLMRTASLCEPYSPYYIHFKS